ncbi:MAG TPA: GTP-binding protein [Alphaproteobacteria bacterium]|jgi:flagellar biosynthesis protein FlhF|nr:GTP-binding protein [Alphaproteobacteria bacterium]
MRLRNFQARTIGDAMADIRAALGDDAVILSTEVVTGGVRVTAACDTAFEEPAPDCADIVDTLYDTLSFHRAPPDLADRLVAIALRLGTDDPVVALGGALDAALRFQPIHLDAHVTAPILLIGPPGQGKTLTAARLAARGVLAGQKVRVVAADPRAGAQAQLAELCRPMKIMPETLSPLDGRAIVDGPGVDPFDADDLLTVRRLAEQSGAEPVLALAAGGDPEEAAEIAEAFAAIGVRRFVATRLDGARRLGGILAAAACGLALADGGVGRTVADTLITMHPVGLARLLIAMRPDAGGAMHADHEVAA